MVEKYYKLREFLEKEIDEMADCVSDGAQIDAHDLQNLKNLLSSVKDIDEILSMKHYERGGRY